MKEILYCYNCNTPLCELDENDYEKKRKYKNEHGHFECLECKRRRHKAYDDYVDPLGVYH